MSRTLGLGRPLRARQATMALFLANGFGIGAWAGAIPALKAGLGLSDSALGLALLAFAAGAIVAMPVAGWLGTRIGSHVAALGAAGSFAAALLLPGWAGSLPWLVAAALAMGACNGVLDVSMNAHATTVERAWGRPIMSSFHAAFSLGGLSGAASVGVLLAAGLAVQAGLAVMALAIAALTVAAVAIGLTGTLPPTPSGAELERSQPAFAWPSRAQLGIGLLAFLGMLIEGAMADWSGVFLATVAGASVAAAPGGYAAFSVAMVTCRAFGDRIVLALGDVRVLQLGAGLAAIGLALALLVARPVAAIVGFALVGLGVANGVPVLFSAASRSPGVAPSVGVAAVASLGYAGFLTGPPVIGLVADVIGLRLALAILLAAAAAIVALAVAILRPRRPPQPPASRAAT